MREEREGEKCDCVELEIGGNEQKETGERARENQIIKEIEIQKLSE